MFVVVVDVYMLVPSINSHCGDDFGFPDGVDTLAPSRYRVQTSSGLFVQSSVVITDALKDVFMIQARMVQRIKL